MTRSPLVLGSHLFFVREGTSFTLPAPGTVSRTALPGAADSSWAYLGIVGELGAESSGEEVEVWKSAPGRLILDDVIPIKAQIKYTLTLREIGPKAIELFFRTGVLSDTSTEFTPLSVAGIKGWLKAQWYDHKDTMQIITDNWVVIKPTGSFKADGQSLAEAQFEARLLFSTLNKGGLA